MADANLNDSTTIALPIRNLVSLIGATAIAVWTYFQVNERLNKLENQHTIVSLDVEKNTEFRIRWPRGEIGSLPADAEQYMLISNLQERLEKLQAMIDGGQAPHDQKQALTLNFYEERIEALENRVEAIKSVQVELVHQQHSGPPK